MRSIKNIKTTLNLTLTLSYEERGQQDSVQVKLGLRVQNLWFLNDMHFILYYLQHTQHWIDSETSSE